MQHNVSTCTVIFSECSPHSYGHSCSAHAKHTFFSAKSVHTLAHFVIWTHFTFF